MTATFWRNLVAALARRQPAAAPALAAVNADLVDQVFDLTAEVMSLRRQLTAERLSLPTVTYAGEAPDATHWRRRSEQDRRNILVVSDALALAEGRRMGAPLTVGLANQLHDAVRKTVTEVLSVELEQVP